MRQSKSKRTPSIKLRVVHYREYHELSEIDRAHIRQRFKLDYNGQGFRDLYMISRDAFRKLKEESRMFAR
ncbi:TPA: hypothetical protein ACJ3CO_003700 [Salmonella enterica subsp. enterica serovar Virchow]|nr:hypothetical protein [Salmonella enterica subsp. enterica serovar Javiana]ECH9478887.1 hypothetical protein [Salmonella enterica subsp. enterica]